MTVFQHYNTYQGTNIGQMIFIGLFLFVLYDSTQFAIVLNSIMTGSSSTYPLDDLYACCPIYLSNDCEILNNFILSLIMKFA